MNIQGFTIRLAFATCNEDGGWKLPKSRDAGQSSQHQSCGTLCADSDTLAGDHLQSSK